jgi:D-aminopeptidase
MKNHQANVIVNKRRHLDRSYYLSLILVLLLAAALVAAHPFSGSSIPQEMRRPRVREAGINVGVLPVGPLNAITDVSGVLVGHVIVSRGETIRTGATLCCLTGAICFARKFRRQYLSRMVSEN